MSMPEPESDETRPQAIIADEAALLQAEIDPRCHDRTARNHRSPNWSSCRRSATRNWRARERARRPSTPE